MSDETSGLEHDEGLWTIGAVTRRTGLSDHALRAWERRYGFPKPVRLPSGHRRYTGDQVRRLVQVARAVGLGHRTGDVVNLPLEQLATLLEAGEHEAPSPPVTQWKDWLERVLDATQRFDHTQVEALLESDSLILGVPRFLRERAVPLLTEVGERWARGELGVRHEHFVSDHLEHHLRELLLRLSRLRHGPIVILACLPQEQHGLGLYLAALEVAAGGLRPRVLGRSTPVEEIVAAADSTAAHAVGISVSLFADPEGTRAGLAELRRKLPPSVELWAGGSGTAGIELPGLRVFGSLDELDEVLSGLRAP